MAKENITEQLPSDIPIISETQFSTDYTQQLSDMALDLAFIKTKIENDINNIDPPPYQQTFLDIQNTLNSINDKLVVPVEEKAVDVPLDYTKDLQLVNETISSISKELKMVNIHCENVSNLNVLCMIGIGILVGCICALIFSNFFRG